MRRDGDGWRVDVEMMYHTTPIDNIHDIQMLEVEISEN